MDSATWGFIGALSGAVIGAAASIITTILGNRSESSLQRQSDALVRAEQARAFQRDNLLALQEALQDLYRLTGRAFHSDMMAFRQGSAWGQTPLGDQIDEALGLANKRLSTLTQRVADDSLRFELRETHRKLTDQIMAESPEEAKALLDETTQFYGELNAHIGEVLRSNY